MKRRSTDFDATLGARIRQLRKLAGVTQSELAEACGMTFQQIQKYERGINAIRVETLLHMTRRLGIGWEQLFDSPATAKLQPWQHDVMVFMDTFGRLPESKKKALLTVAQGLRYPAPATKSERN